MSFCAWSKGEVYKDHFEPGIYVCAKCDHELFGSESKYGHHTPWPAFAHTKRKDSVSKFEEKRGAYKLRASSHASFVGIYVCSECDHPLFSSHAKYEHHTPWPAFETPLQPDSLSKKPEQDAQESSDCVALKVSCGKCGNGLGHEFVGDGPGGKGSRF